MNQVAQQGIKLQDPLICEAYISCVGCKSVCQPRPVIQRQINSVCHAERDPDLAREGGDEEQGRREGEREEGENLGRGNFS